MVGFKWGCCMNSNKVLFFLNVSSCVSGEILYVDFMLEGNSLKEGLLSYEE
jgi:hypothetical protein